MSERFRDNWPSLGDAYHRLFMGQDSEEAEAAALHLGETLERIRRYLEPPQQ